MPCGILTKEKTIDLTEVHPVTALEAIFQRRCYRGKYKPVPVPREHLKIILEAGLAAPSGCNLQTTSLIAVDDPALLNQLQALSHSPAVKTAPALLFVLTRRVIAYEDKCFAVQDYAAAIENMLLALPELGYRSCWYEGHVTGPNRLGYRMAQLLSVPDEYELVCMLPVGVAEDAVPAPEKKPFEQRACFNGFSL